MLVSGAFGREREQHVQRALQLARALVGERGVEGGLGVVRVAG
jgi:hypothetical protein